MKKFIIFSLLLFFTACTSNSDNQKSLDLFNGSTFELNESEKELAMTLHIKESYLDLIKEKSLQIPLFKIVKGPKYHIFIGLPVNTSLTEIFKAPLFNDSIKLEFKTDTTSYDYKKFKYEENYISEYVSEKEGNLIYILSVTDSEEISDSLFNFEKLSNRLQLKNNE
ncbi:hypothetical protein ERX46_06160 [Brumimicrobium glaciale]|uniref:DUF4252 domain-containing protein n=1 Tax=Brumimicrobium glaciale TaxID=200475 RepID=A0A4Q4KQV8_9FLAO|nr:hypothetical protein [Brumimicrobium glaciale]RYM34954.1 hypothetical protein ERX46_06160 [Brumimicrobium glaciale]